MRSVGARWWPDTVTVDVVEDIVADHHVAIVAIDPGLI
jgi:hypothetical protein